MKELLPDVLSTLAGMGPALHSFEGKRILITGARGYLGRYVVAALVEMNKRLRQPCEILAVDSMLTGASNTADWHNIPHLSFMKHDVKTGVGVVPEKLDFILHLAGIASPYWYKKLPLETISVAVDGSRQMLELAKEHKARYLFTSSSEVYQTASIVPTPESYVGAIPSMTERSSYDVSKLMAETLTYIYTQQGLDAVVIRIFNSFGVGMSEKDKRILPRVASAIKGNRPVKIYGRPLQTPPRRTYSPVANTLLGLFTALLKGKTGEVYNVGVDSPEISVQELVSRIAAVTGREVRYEFEQPPSNYETEPLRRCPDISKLKRLGFLPVVDLDEGLRRFFSWALETYTG